MKLQRFQFIAAVFLMVIIASAFAIVRYEDFNIYFLLLLITQLIFSLLLSKKFSAFFIGLSRTLLGGLFIFSGLVKGVDPVGFQYKLEDYFIAFNMDWAMPWALILSIIINAAEFILGVMLVLNIQLRITSFLVFLMMAFFTLTTFYDALYSPVPDCGCFGDFLKITNWQTFYKNLIIDALVFIVFLNRNRSDLASFKILIQYLFILFFLTGFIFFEIFNFRHLPIWDFRDWKEGKRMVIDNPEPEQYFLTYKNKESGELQEYLSPNYPYNDSVWMNQWEFYSQRIVDPNPKLTDLTITDGDGFDHTQEILCIDTTFFFIIIPFVEDLDEVNFEGIADFTIKSFEHGYQVMILTSSFEEEINRFLKSYNIDIPYYFSDNTELEAMIRSNPGLIWMKDGVVVKKWHYRDVPDFSEIIKKL